MGWIMEIIKMQPLEMCSLGKHWSGEGLLRRVQKKVTLQVSTLD